jgi:hypothetical protein
MTNKEILIDAMDTFIVGYGSLEYGGLPFVTTIMYNILPDIPVAMKFTAQDISDVANYFNTKYPGYFTYDEWNDTITEYLSDHITEIEEEVPEETTTTEANSSKALLAIGGIVVLIAVLSIR